MGNMAGSRTAMVTRNPVKKLKRASSKPFTVEGVPTVSATHTEVLSAVYSASGIPNTQTSVLLVTSKELYHCDWRDNSEVKNTDQGSAPSTYIRFDYNLGDVMGALFCHINKHGSWPQIHRNLPASVSQVLGLKSHITFFPD